METYLKVSEKTTSKGNTLYGIRRVSDDKGVWMPSSWVKFTGVKTDTGEEVVTPASRVKAIRFMMLDWHV